MLGKFYIKEIVPEKGKQPPLLPISICLSKEHPQLAMGELRRKLNEALVPHGYRLSAFHRKLLLLIPPPEYFGRKWNSAQKSPWEYVGDDITFGDFTFTKGMSRKFYLTIRKIP
jgi:hypothetical protein